MLIIAQHEIQETEKFWAAAKAVTESLPSGLKVHSVFPSADMKKGTCLWEGPSVMEVQNFLDANTEGMATNFCYEVNQAAAMGAPQMAMEAALNN